MRFAKPFLYGFFIIAILVMAFVVWASAAMGPAPEALESLRSDDHITVIVDKYIVFQPVRKNISTGFVFYPGARVDYRSYAAPLRRIAAEGYLVILLPVRLNLALLDVNAATEAIAAFPSIRHWVLGGHSLGGVAAAAYTSNHDKVQGLVFWASYPGNASLKNSDLRVLSIYGTRDIGGTDVFEGSRALLPSNTEYAVIDGGNHAQFGDYGAQPGDQEATISRSEQQKQIVEATLKFLKEISE